MLNEYNRDQTLSKSISDIENSINWNSLKKPKKLTKQK